MPRPGHANKAIRVKLTLMGKVINKWILEKFGGKQTLQRKGIKWNRNRRACVKRCVDVN